MAGRMDASVLREKETWQAFALGTVLFCIIAYTSLGIFGFSSSLYGVSEEVREVPDFEVGSLNRTGIDNEVSDQYGEVRLSQLRGKIVILDFMSIDCGNCHYVQKHIEDNYDSWKSMNSSYPVVVISIASWYGFDTFEMINETFGEAGSDRHMRWPVVNGANDAIILGDGMRGDLVEYYSAQSLPLALVVDHEGFVVAKEGTGTPLDDWESFDNAIFRASNGDAEDLRFGVKKTDSSFFGVFIVGLFLGILVYFSPCAFPVLPSYISYYLNLGMRGDELLESGAVEGGVPSSLEAGSLAALGQLTFFVSVGLVILGLNDLVDLSGLLNQFAVVISLILVLLGAMLLLGWTSQMLAWVQDALDRYKRTDASESFSPRLDMFLWGIGYSAASVDCTAAAVFPFIAWLVLLGDGALVMGMSGLVLSASLLMISVTVLVGMGRNAMIDRLRKSTALVKATGAWMMMFAGLGLFAYLTQPDLVSAILG
ncbi:MAG TPA: cytochrome c biogenesis protein CcdA [Candidatus Thalassarchaeaceae archaeon]|nr:cytochrome c biogenesis protein CcdA [Candidatus Thalassarchaeaceae archaeon]